MAKKKGDPRTPEEIQKEIQELLKKYEKLDDYILKQRSGWDSINATLFKINDNDFFAKIKRSAEQTADIAANLKESQIELLSTGKALGDSIATILNGTQKQYQNISTSFSNQLDELAKKNALMADSLRTGLVNKDLTDFFQTFGKEGMDAFKAIVEDKKGYAALKKWIESDAVKNWETLIDKTDELGKSFKETTEEVISLRKSVVAIGEYFTRDFMPAKVLTKLHDFDQILNDTQKNFGLAMDANSAKFTELIGQNQIFGMGAQENAQFMGTLGESLRTTNFDVLSQAAKDMGALHLATGLSVDEMQNLGHQLMFYGKSSEQVRKFTEETMQTAQKYGLNAKKVLQEVTKALPDSRKLGWQGGAKALAEMVMQAQKLGQNIDDLSNSAKKLRTLEGSIEASADLALVGVNTNAIQMLAAARRGGKEFSSFVSDLTKGIGQIKKDGSVEFDPIDIDRLNVIADAVGIPIEKLQDQVAMTAQRNAKINLFPQSMFSGLTDEQREFVLNATQLSEDGTLKFSGELGNITDASQISGDMLKTLMDNKNTLDKQAEQNQSFNKSVENLKASIYNLFTIFQPFITSLTNVILSINNFVKGFGEMGKTILAASVLFGAIFFSVAKHYLAGYWYGQGFNSAVTKSGFLQKITDSFKSLFGGFKKAIPTTPPTTTTGGGGIGGATGPTPNTTRNTSSFAEALKAMPSPAQLLALAAAIAAVGVAFVGIGYGIKLASDGLSELVKSFDGITNAGYALGAVSIVMAGFVGMLGLMIPIIGALGATAVAVWPGLLALGAAFVGMGFGIKLATDGVTNLINSFKGLESSSAAMWSIVAVMGSFVAISALLIPNLIGLGGALVTFGSLGMVAVAPLLALGAAAVGVGFGIKLAADGFANLVKSFDGITNSIPALFSIVAIMGGMTATMYALIPALGGLGLALTTFGALGATAILPLLALGAAAVGIGYGISLAIDSLGKLAKSFDGISNAIPGLLSITSVMAGMTLSIFALVPAIGALGTSLVSFGALGMVAVPPLLALSAASIGIGYAISLVIDSLSNMIDKFGEVSNINSVLVGLGISVLGLVGSIFALTPAFGALSVALASLGTVGFVAVPVLIALGGAAVGIGYGINLAVEGIASLVKAFAEMKSASSSLATVGSNMGFLSTGIFALAPAFTALGSSMSVFGATGMLAVPTLLAIGTAAVAVGFGVKLATEGFSNLVKSFDSLNNKMPVLTSFGVVLGGMALSIYALIPALSSFAISLVSFGTAGLVAVPVLLAVGAAAVGIGYGINLALKGLASLSKSFENIKISASGLTSIGIVIAGMALSIYALIPAIGSLGIAMSSFGAIGSVAVLPLLVLGAAAIGIGYGINLAIKGISELVSKISEISNITPVMVSLGIAIGAISLGALALIPSIAALVTALVPLSTVGFVAIPALLALGGAFIGLGYGINLASKGISEIVSSFKEFDGVSSSIVAASTSILGFVGALFLMTPAVVSFASSMALLGTSGMIAIPVLLAVGAAATIFGAAIKVFGEGISSAVKSFGEFSNITNKLSSDSAGLSSVAKSLLAFTPAIIGLGIAGLISSPGILAFSVALGMMVPVLSMFVPLIDKISNLKTDSLKSIGQNLGNLSVGIMSFAGVGVLFPLIALASGAISLITDSLGSFSEVLGNVSNVNFDGIKTMREALVGLIPSLSAFSVIGVLSPLIGLASSVLGFVGHGLSQLSKVEVGNIGEISKTIDQIVPSLTKLSLIGILSAPIVLAAGALTFLGNSLNVLSNSLSKTSSVDWTSLTKMSDGLNGIVPSLIKFSALGILSAPIALASMAISLIGQGFLSASKGFQSMSSIEWANIDKMSASLNNLLPTIVSFGFKGIVAAPGVWLMNSAISSLANTMERLANPLDIANESLGSMSENVERLKSAIQGLDTSTLNNLANVSGEFINSTVQASAVESKSTEPSKPQKITFEPLVINLKMNGRDLQEIVIKDIQYST